MLRLDSFDPVAPVLCIISTVQVTLSCGLIVRSFSDSDSLDDRICNPNSTQSPGLAPSIIHLRS
jgi:hypothetical protein